MRGLLFGFVTAAWLTSSPALAQVAAPTPEIPAPVQASLRAVLDDWARAATHRGVSATVVLPDGATWTDAAGQAADGEPLRPDHLIQIASITKTMTAAVVLQLVDEGVVRLEDPVGRWLAPRWWVSPSITVRQLLNHSAGVANYTASPALGTAINRDESRVWTADELLQFVGPPRFAPGVKTEYTNTSFVLLGQIAEAATGRSIVELYRQRLWAPLGLDEIFMPGVQDPPGPVAVAQTNGQRFQPLDHLSVLSIGNSAFGLLATARTVARWGHALFAGSVISAERQAEMRTLIPAAGNIAGETGSGLGIRGYAYLDRAQIGHSGGATFGTSLLLFDPSTGVSVAVVMNQAGGADHFTLAPRLLEIATTPQAGPAPSLRSTRTAP